MKLKIGILLSVAFAYSQIVTAGFTKTVTTSGTVVTLTASRTLARWVLIQALAANTGSICVGGSDVTCANKKGVTLSAGQSLGLMPVGELKDVNKYDMLKIYIDSSVNAEGVQVTYAQ